MAGKCLWPGASGKKYKYEIYPIDSNYDWEDKPGNYIFAREFSLNKWQAIYIGETESLKDCLPSHHKLQCIHRNEGTHIHAHINQDSLNRLDEEADLLNYFKKTPCN